MAALLAAAQAALILVSWIVNAAMPQLMVRSLLSSEGIRWFFGHFTSMVLAPPMAWLLLAAMAWGAVRTSGLTEGCRAFLSRRRITFRQNFALGVAAALLLAAILSVAALTLPPQAILLSASGTLAFSPFSASLVPMLAFVGIVVAAAYGAIVGTIPSLQALFRSLCGGLQQCAPFIVLLLLASQLWFSLLYILSVL